MRERPIVAIDGPAGAGKSTLGRSMADALGLPYVNTGLMYRALTARALAKGADLDDPETLVGLARSLRFDLDRSTQPAELSVDGTPPGAELTGPAVEGSVSRVARHRPVRAVLAAEQRRLGEEGVVMEGRDIGTVVFPDADVKLFLRADPATRARRRVAERQDAPPDELASGLARRDALDARVNPLVAAWDAIAIDTADREPAEVLSEALEIVRARLEEGRAGR